MRQEKPAGLKTNNTHYINGEWVRGTGRPFASANPANGEVLWAGDAADAGDVDKAVVAARAAFEEWAWRPFEERLAYCERFKSLVEQHKTTIAHTIAKETGKVLWDSEGEAGALSAKLAVSVKAFHERTGEHHSEAMGTHAAVRHKPHGVMAVFGPYNFPAHLPNGHIIPALLAGNTIVLKPSEQTPLVAQVMVELWHEAGLPKGVINLVQGERATGIALSAHQGIDGLLFTGSSATGLLLQQQFAATPYKILALEMGGNNPLVVHRVSDVKAAAYHTIQSAYITSGQRCSCARRLIVVEGANTDRYLGTLMDMTKNLVIGSYDETPQPFLGPLISNAEVEKLLSAQRLLEQKGAKILLPMRRVRGELPFISPGLLDVTNVQNLPDKEYFGPLLQMIRVKDFEEAIRVANNTSYGLTAGLLSDHREDFDVFLKKIRAGIINWNRPTTGSNSAAPYGGLGMSGNHRPAAFYAADYCAYPVASMEVEQLTIPATPSPGMKL